MKLSDFILQYPSRWRKDSHGVCRVRLFTPGGQPVALLTEPRDNDFGPSITNAAESVIATLVQRGYVPAGCRFIEHYEKADHRRDTFDTLSLSPLGRPVWQSVSADEVLALLQCPPAELAGRTAEDPRLVAEIERIRYALDPRAGLAPSEPASVVQRRLAIEASMLSKAELSTAIAAGAGERELQELIAGDLSLLGEIYARPADEYICFSQFPIGDGCVDFAVFAGRSRMDVFLIEIKGAAFNLVNSGSYPEFNAHINRAAGQIRKRYRAIFEALPAFRRSFHDLRIRAEAGENVFRAFLGPYAPLDVDPDKDINVHGVVIGGRMRDDLAESRHRQDYESRLTPRIMIDSWDSWLKRLQRA